MMTGECSRGWSPSGGRNCSNLLMACEFFPAGGSGAMWLQAKRLPSRASAIPIFRGALAAQVMSPDLRSP